MKEKKEKKRLRIKKWRHHFACKVPYSQSYVVVVVYSLIVMYGCECWTINKDECQRIDAFELRCWRRLLRDPWTASESMKVKVVQSCPTFFSPMDCRLPVFSMKFSRQEYWSGLLGQQGDQISQSQLKPTLNIHFVHLIGRSNSFENNLMTGSIGSKRERA